MKTSKGDRVNIYSKEAKQYLNQLEYEKEYEKEVKEINDLTIAFYQSYDEKYEKYEKLMKETNDFIQSRDEEYEKEVKEINDLTFDEKYEKLRDEIKKRTEIELQDSKLEEKEIKNLTFDEKYEKLRDEIKKRTEIELQDSKLEEEALEVIRDEENKHYIRRVVGLFSHVDVIDDYEDFNELWFEETKLLFEMLNYQYTTEDKHKIRFSNTLFFEMFKDKFGYREEELDEIYRSNKSPMEIDLIRKKSVWQNALANIIRKYNLIDNPKPDINFIFSIKNNVEFGMYCMILYMSKDYAIQT